MFLMFYLTKCSANYGELISQSTEVIQNSESLSPEIARVIKITENGREEGVINFSRADDEELVPAIEIYNGTRTELGWSGYASTVRSYGGCHTQYLINNILTFFCRGDLYSIDAITGDRVGSLQVMGDEDNNGDFVYFKDDIFVVTGDKILSLDGSFSEDGGIYFARRNPDGTFTELKITRIPDMVNNCMRIEIINDSKIIVWVSSGAQPSMPTSPYNTQYANYMTAYVIDNITINGDNITHSPVEGPSILDTSVGNQGGSFNRLSSKALTDEITVRAYYKNRGQDTLIAVSLVNKVTKEEVQTLDPETEDEKLTLWGDSITDNNSGSGDYLIPYISIEELENGNKIVSLLYIGREDRYVISVFNFNISTNKLEQIGNYPLGYLGDYPANTGHKSGAFLKTKAKKDGNNKNILVLDSIYPYKFTTGSPSRRASMNQDTLTIDLETGIVLSSTSTTTSTTTTTPTTTTTMEATTDAETTAATTTTTSSSSSSTNSTVASSTSESSTTTEVVSPTRSLEITSTTVDNTTGETTSTFNSSITLLPNDESSSTIATTFKEETTNTETGELETTSEAITIEQQSSTMFLDSKYSETAWISVGASGGVLLTLLTAALVKYKCKKSQKIEAIDPSLNNNSTPMQLNPAYEESYTTIDGNIRKREIPDDNREYLTPTSQSSKYSSISDFAKKDTTSTDEEQYSESSPDFLYSEDNNATLSKSREEHRRVYEEPANRWYMSPITSSSQT